VTSGLDAPAAARPLSVSTVIPTFNRAHLIARAVDSALAQHAPGDEILIVDDGSTDDTARVVSRYGSAVRYIRTPNRGAGAARNRGIQEARGDLVAFLDSDDEWMPGKLDLARRWLAARPDVLFVFSDFAITDDDGTVTRRYLINWHRDARAWDEILGPGAGYATTASLPAGMADFPVHSGDLYVREFERGYVLTSSFVIRRVEAGDALRFSEDVASMEDLECFGRVSRLGPGTYFDTETTWQHGQAVGRISQRDEFSKVGDTIVVLERVWGADAAFLASHGREYRRVLDAHRLRHVVMLARQGRMAEARAELGAVERPPFRYRVLTRVPAPLARTARTWWRRLRRQPADPPRT
jgi:GT2 family glycosyltransferase